MATGVGGFSTTGVKIAGVTDISKSALVVTDTENPNGSSPQCLATPFGIISQASQVFDTITATPGGTKAAAKALNYGVNRISVCATATNSVLMPFAVPGAWVYLINDGAASATVFGAGTDTIDAVASATGNPMAAAKRALFYAVTGDGLGTAGTWYSSAGAKIT